MDNILKETINTMKETIDKLNLTNIEQTKEELKKYFVVIETIASIEESKLVQMISEEPEEIEEVEFESAAKPTFEIRPKSPVINKPLVFTEEEKEEEPALDLSYPFERRLSGGFLRTENTESDIFVPEKYVRELDIKDGDMVFADEIGTDYQGRTNYHYEVIKRTSEKTENDRKEFVFAIVELDESSGRYVIYENIHKEKLRTEDGDMTTYVLNEKEMNQFNIDEGSIVDLAWYSGSFDTARVVWHYHISDVEEEKMSESKRILNYNKNHSSSTKKEKEEVEKVLQGKTICLIGLEPYWAKYKELVEERGGELETVESERHKTSMTAAIRRSDLVVVGISHTSHAASQYANTRAKVYGVPFTSISGYGGETFLNAVLENIKEIANN